MCLNSHYRLWGLVGGIKTVNFFIGTYVWKLTASLLPTKYHHITCWTHPLLLLTARGFSSGSIYKKSSMWRPATSTHTRYLAYYHVESEEDLLARVMAAENVTLPGIGDRVYKNMVRRYRECAEVPGRHIDPLLEVGPEKQRTVSSRKWRVQHVMWWYFVCNDEAVCLCKASRSVMGI